jgi:hypothetical protein
MLRPRFNNSTGREASAIARVTTGTFSAEKLTIGIRMPIASTRHEQVIG